ncbi:membrane integrity-associated transporter subunit PqiC [Ralstonia pickettii]|uniref:PqiC family protein n=1 Tax=Ralstonia pickettii TaxID=329 RepID=UPI0015FB75C4|nr:PqiC family protein [Ralstonia pickettii]MBB0026351.1 membrane integrity-associated transporter subunit PqiC [Ralstonia pickettii]MBB0037131.1 membrane integrity-associated transporter subunit PqiC [Ralstonia pickettii]MBB0099679.1 membrane integrity-associated transporter subunit PqiC [Ralstonia pickettii]MBB0109466.1 membrane integrity-associated transporter subunit PqiC [Ralstonia pickettii]MBB0130445.1 membrane integrity-associated transporter subunit PqiC [Ralstonia pickettii]
MVSWLPICRTLAGVVACAALAACSSPPARFHSLLGADADGVAASAPAQAPVRTYLVDVVAVRVPPSVAGRRLVVQAGSGQVDVLEMDRWASPVADEIRAALSSGLALQIRAMDLHGLPYDGRWPVYRVAVDVQRFDAWRGSHVLIDAVWTMRTAEDRQLLTCRSVVQEVVSAGIDGVVEGHRRALKALASQMAEALLAYAAAPAEVVRPMPGCLDSATSTVGK